jgi:hypothetical protein
MNAGLPGTGIGGLFYIIGALWMPVSAVWRVATGRSAQVSWRLVARQSGIAAGVLAGLAATGWALGWAAALASIAPEALTTGRLATIPQVQSAVRWAVVIGSTGVLAGVLLLVQVLRLVVRRTTPLVIAGRHDAGTSQAAIPSGARHPAVEPRFPGFGDEEREAATSPLARIG